MSGRLESIIGVEIVAGDIRLGHTFHEVDVIEQIISMYKPNLFFEVGVHEGGLSYLLIPKRLVNYYVGIELYCGLIRPVVNEMYHELDYAQLLCMDCFSSTVYKKIEEVKNKLIYCDGGAKAREILFFKEALYPGDIIMCHDFYDGTREVRGVPKENISIEVTASDVQIYENDTAFERLPEDILKETRIIGWRKL